MRARVRRRALYRKNEVRLELNGSGKRGMIEEQEDGGETEVEREAADLWSHWNVIWWQKLLSACARFRVSEA